MPHKSRYRRTNPIDGEMESVRHNGETTMVIRKWGYEYTLVEGSLSRETANIPPPNFMGHSNWALRSCCKINK